MRWTGPAEPGPGGKGEGIPGLAGPGKGPVRYSGLGKLSLVELGYFGSSRSGHGSSGQVEHVTTIETDMDRKNRGRRDVVSRRWARDMQGVVRSEFG